MTTNAWWNEIVKVEMNERSLFPSAFFLMFLLFQSSRKISKTLQLDLHKEDIYYSNLVQNFWYFFQNYVEMDAVDADFTLV